jgi:hypothetical protein
MLNAAIVAGMLCRTATDDAGSKLGETKSAAKAGEHIPTKAMMVISAI